MHQENYFFPSKKVACYFNADFSYLETLVTKENSIIITDENLLSCHSAKLNGWKKIVIKAGEQYKQQATADDIIGKLINFKADRETFIIGVGGGVVTDIAGYVASIYMRGLRFGFVPTTVLAMVDACVGGKNGIDVGIYKNLIGCVKQPDFLLYDISFLETLPQDQWINGFAEIIKHACIKDKYLFELLENNSLQFFKSSTEVTSELIKKNVEIKYNIVCKDELETGERRLLNFGHTLGHAIENLHTLPHGHAVSIGIVAACSISELIAGFNPVEKKRVTSLLQQYQLPVHLNFDKDHVWRVLLMDKKKSGIAINFVLLEKIGQAVVKKFPVNELHDLYNKIQF